MKTIKIPNKSWVLVCDAAKALLLRNDGDGEHLNLTPVKNRD
ncbi:host attachment family protein (plasmid) [Rhizobium sullae]|uniref:Host attachment family protein n=1 Tax=Rhizobium sullae TaxID=50338 RepID=A0ABY5XVK8_RHISU|nr:host attachment family protein [Rhizobium sullae]UWU18649.1 host attachment family protein [Rhizobium sullae]